MELQLLKSVVVGTTEICSSVMCISLVIRLRENNESLSGIVRRMKVANAFYFIVSSFLFSGLAKADDGLNKKQIWGLDGFLREEWEFQIGVQPSNVIMYWTLRDGHPDKLLIFSTRVERPNKVFVKLNGEKKKLKFTKGNSGCSRKRNIEQIFEGEGVKVVLKGKYWGLNLFGGEVYRGSLSVLSEGVSKIYSVEGEYKCYY